LPSFSGKMAEHNMIQLIWVSGHIGIDGNERADQLTGQGPSNALTGSETFLGISAKVARGVTVGLTSRKHKECWQSVHR
jgi:ribonuclease HI